MHLDSAFKMDQVITAGDVSELASLLSHEPRLTGTPIPVPREWGEEMWLALHRAVEQGKSGMVNLLLDSAASIDSRTRFRTPMHARETPLMIASRCGHETIVKDLIDRHAALDLLDANHCSALSHAAQKGHDTIVRRLLDAGCRVDTVDDQGRTPLHSSIAGGHVASALLLIEAGSDLGHRCPKEPAGTTPLHRCRSIGGKMDQVASYILDRQQNQPLSDQ